MLCPVSPNLTRTLTVYSKGEVKVGLNLFGRGCIYCPTVDLLGKITVSLCNPHVLLLQYGTFWIYSSPKWPTQVITSNATKSINIEKHF